MVHLTDHNTICVGLPSNGKLNGWLKYDIKLIWEESLTFKAIAQSFYLMKYYNKLEAV